MLVHYFRLAITAYIRARALSRMELEDYASPFFFFFFFGLVLMFEDFIRI